MSTTRHLDRPAFVKECKSTKSTLKADIVEAQAITDQTKVKDIIDEAVTVTCTREFCVERPYLFFTASEYKTTFTKAAPTGKNALVVSLPCEDTDEQEKLWYVKDDGTRPAWLGPHRKGHITTKKVISHDNYLMTKKTHKFARQAGRIVKHNLKTKGVDKMKSKKVRTLTSEYKRRNDGAAGGAAAEDASDDDDDDDAMELEPEPQPVPQPPAAAPQTPRGAASASAAPATSPGADLAAGLRNSTPTRSNVVRSPGGASVSICGSPPGDPLRRGVASLDLLETQTIAGETAFGIDDEEDDDFDETQEQDLSLEQRVQARCASLQPAATLCNTKFGNQERRLKELLAKLHKDPTANASLIVQLSTTQGLQDFCKTISLAQLAGNKLPLDAFLGKMTRLKGYGITLLPQYKKQVFLKFVQLKIANSTLGAIGDLGVTDDANNQLILERCLPWGPKEFDPTLPSLSALEATDDLKFMTFQNTMMVKIFIPLLCGSTAKSDVALAVSKYCLAKFENMPEDLELSEESTTVTCDCMVGWRTIKAIDDITSVVNLSPEEFDVYRKSVETIASMSQKGSSRNIKALVGQALASDNEYWWPKVQRFLSAAGDFADLGPKINSCKAQIAILSPGKREFGHALVLAAQTHLIVLDKLEQFKEFWGPFADLILDQILGHVKAVLDSLGAGSAAANLQMLKDTADAVQEVSFALPEEALVVEVASNVGKAIHKVETTAKTAALTTACSDLQQESYFSTDFEAKVEETLSLLDKAQGATRMSSMAGTNIFNTVVDQWQKKFNTEFFQNDLERLLEKLLPLLHSADEGAARSLVNYMKHLSTAWQAMKPLLNVVDALPGNVFNDEQVDGNAIKGAGLKNLRDIQEQMLGASAHKELLDNSERASITALPTVLWLNTVLATAKQVVLKGSLLFRDLQKDKVENALHVLKACAGGLPDGKAWDDVDNAPAAWDDYIQLAASTLLKSEACGDIPEAMDNVFKDRTDMGL